MTLRPSTAPRWKIATSVFFPFVVEAFAIRTKTLGNSPPATSARPDDLKNVLRFIMGSSVLVARLPGDQVAKATRQPGHPATDLSLSLELGRAEDQADHHRDLGVVPF